MFRESFRVAKTVPRFIFGDFEDPMERRDYALTNILQPIHGKLRHISDFRHVDVTEADWDNLIVLDACRADLFEEVVDLGLFDNYQRVISNASNTSPWTYRNFNESYTQETYGDTVYVSANPVTSHEAPNAFHRLNEVWNSAFDEEIHSVPPEPVADEALEAHSTYPDKRLVAHFLQPHMPFVKTPEIVFRKHWRPEIDYKNEEYEEPDPPRTVWEALEMGIVERDVVWEGYKKNLEFGFESAMRLAAELSGRTVITSDHGNLLGERGLLTPIDLYGHPPDLRSPELVKVPWAVIDDGDRREIADGEVESESVVADDLVKERLRDLGYY